MKPILMKAKKLSSIKELSRRGWWISEKYDGMRAYWDGGTYRGVPCSEVPWANQTKPDRLATGLWSIYGTPINAATGWLDQLPIGVELDGELYSPDIPREDIFSIVRRYAATEGMWRRILFYTFETVDRCVFEVRYENMLRSVEDSDICVPVEQTVLSSNWKDEIDARMEIVREGIVIRQPLGLWKPGRSAHVLKLKRMDEDEGVIVAFNWGEGKYQGMLGSVTLQMRQSSIRVNVNIRGDVYREVRDVAPDGSPLSQYYTVGDVVTIRYRGLTAKGVPQEAVLLGRRDYE